MAQDSTERLWQLPWAPDTTRLCTCHTSTQSEADEVTPATHRLDGPVLTAVGGVMDGCWPRGCLPDLCPQDGTPEISTPRLKPAPALGMLATGSTGDPGKFPREAPSRPSSRPQWAPRPGSDSAPWRLQFSEILNVAPGRAGELLAGPASQIWVWRVAQVEYPEESLGSQGGNSPTVSQLTSNDPLDGLLEVLLPNRGA